MDKCPTCCMQFNDICKWNKYNIEQHLTVCQNKLKKKNENLNKTKRPNNIKPINRYFSVPSRNVSNLFIFN